MRVSSARDAVGRPGDRLVFRACATFYAGALDREACLRVVEALGARRIRAEAVSHRRRGIVTLAFGLGAGTAEDAGREAEALLARACRDAGLGDVPHALGVVRVAR
jgi:hypothetical protein